MNKLLSTIITKGSGNKKILGAKSKTLIMRGKQDHKAPVLLLQGEDFCVSQDGTTRTMYRLPPRPYQKTQQSTDSLLLEEIYDLNSAHKTFVIRTSNFPEATKPNHNVIHASKPLHTFHTQEIHPNLLQTAGTGLTTWESSIAMALFFFHQKQINNNKHNNENILKGDVIEIGSGVGLGGILTYLLSSSLRLPPGPSSSSSKDTTLKSFTMTDYNSQVLEKCEMNVRLINKSLFGDGSLSPLKSAIPETSIHVSSLNWNQLSPLKSAIPETSIHVLSLNWNQFSSSKSIKNNELNEKKYNYDARYHHSFIAINPQSHRYYDTIIASDIAYRYEDVIPISNTLFCLLKPKDESDHDSSKAIHLFGPYNRGALHELIKELKCNTDMETKVEVIEMERYRLKPQGKEERKNEKQGERYPDEHQTSQSEINPNTYEKCPYVSMNISKFLHITVNHKLGKNKKRVRLVSLSDID